VVIIPEWNVLRALDLPRVRALRNSSMLVHLRNVCEPEGMTGMTGQGFRLYLCRPEYARPEAMTGRRRIRDGVSVSNRKSNGKSQGF